MRRASIAEFKARLSEYVDAVRAGEEVIITDRNMPVAKLGPVGLPAHGEARTMALTRAGLARPAVKPLPRDFWQQPRPRDPEGRVLAALIEERDDGR
jgi:prevent-host-death family protein